jgi:hypothetical protein
MEPGVPLAATTRREYALLLIEMFQIFDDGCTLAAVFEAK